MRKLNLGEASIIETGLHLYEIEVKKEIQKIIDSGKTPIMTEGFIEMHVQELIQTVRSLTKKGRR